MVAAEEVATVVTSAEEVETVATETVETEITEIEVEPTSLCTRRRVETRCINRRKMTADVKLLVRAHTPRVVMGTLAPVTATRRNNPILVNQWKRSNPLAFLKTTCLKRSLEISTLSIEKEILLRKMILAMLKRKKVTTRSLSLTSQSIVNSKRRMERKEKISSTSS